MAGCKDLSGALPAGTQDPTYYNNATGAIGMRNAALYAYGNALRSYIVESGLLTDELTDPSTFVHLLANVGSGVLVDERVLPEFSSGSTGTYTTDGAYNYLQGTRLALTQAIGQLASYDTSATDTLTLPPSKDSVLRGELYALYGFTEIELADLFCSGIPLTTLNFQKDFTYREGSTTMQVYQDAIARLDTALALSVHSDSIQNLARIGLGRAYLDIGNFAAAADDVSSVPMGYRYQYIQPLNEVFFSSGPLQVTSDNEGGNGLPFISGHDPREAAESTLTTLVGPSGGHVSYYVHVPEAYRALLTGKTAPITIASGIEGWLIRSEAALHGATPENWLALLNDLRAHAPIPGTTQPQPTMLPTLDDPGVGSPNPDSARVALVLRERAAWLYMTGHRQGDLRRQLRQYAQYWPSDQQVYPAGRYPGFGPLGSYGSDVTAPIPAGEYINPLFHGCVNRVP